jgi:cobalt-precorrin-5B (C1)-methyltransferase
MAQGAPHTHAAKSKLTLNKLSQWALEISNNPEFANQVLSANTARHAFDIIIKPYPELISHVGQQVIKSASLFAGKNIQIQCVIFNYDGTVAYDSAKD